MCYSRQMWVNRISVASASVQRQLEPHHTTSSSWFEPSAPAPGCKLGRTFAHMLAGATTRCDGDEKKYFLSRHVLPRQTEIGHDRAHSTFPAAVDKDVGMDLSDAIAGPARRSKPVSSLLLPLGDPQDRFARVGHWPISPDLPCAGAKRKSLLSQLGELGDVHRTNNSRSALMPHLLPASTRALPKLAGRRGSYAMQAVAIQHLSDQGTGTIYNKLL